VLWSEGFYDHNDINNPVKFKLVKDYRMYLDGYSARHPDFDILYNKVTLINGTEQEFYTVHIVSQTFVKSLRYGYWAFLSQLANKYIHYKQVEISVPVFGKHIILIFIDQGERRLDTVTTNVTSSKKENESMSYPFYVFYIISNLGGLYAFMMIILGFITKPFTDKVLDHVLVNDCT
jgi:hypothetical protein